MSNRCEIAIKALIYVIGRFLAGTSSRLQRHSRISTSSVRRALASPLNQHSGKASSTTYLANLAMASALLAAAQPARSQTDMNQLSEVSGRTAATVDPITQNLQLQIPLASYPGRGESSLPVVLTYSSRVWQSEINDPSSSFFGEQQINFKYARGSFAGWRSSLDCTILNGEERGAPSDTVGQRNSDGFRGKVARSTFVLLDGQRIEFRRDDSFYLGSADVTSGVFNSVKSEKMRREGDTVFLPDGSRFSRAGNGCELIDRHGNRIVAQPNTNVWRDSLNREIASPFSAFTNRADGTNVPAGDYNYDLPGFGGQAQRYIFKWRRLDAAGVRTDPTNQAILTIGDAVPTGKGTFTLSPPSLFRSNGVKTQAVLKGSLFVPVVLHEISLPNGQKYTFNYNNYGELERVVSPTGGVQQFSYTQVRPVSFSFPGGVQAQSSRGVFESTLIDSAGIRSVTRYRKNLAFTNNQISGITVTVTRPDASRLEMGLLPGFGTAGGTGGSFPNPLNGLPAEIKVVDASNRLLSRRLIEYGTQTSAEGAIRNPSPIRIVDILPGTGLTPLVTHTTLQYDALLNVTQTTLYHYSRVANADTLPLASLPLSGSILRRQEVDYLDSPAYRARQLLDLPIEVRVSDGTTIYAKSRFRYDESAYPIRRYVSSFAGWIDPWPSHNRIALAESRRHVGRNAYAIRPVRQCDRTDGRARQHQQDRIRRGFGLRICDAYDNACSFYRKPEYRDRQTAAA
jgi:hypothetical protein